jgi:hypothetical protein
VTAGFPVTRLPVTDELVQMRLPGGKAVQAMHLGTYPTLAETGGSVRGSAIGISGRPR